MPIAYNAKGRYVSWEAMKTWGFSPSKGWGRAAAPQNVMSGVKIGLKRLTAPDIVFAVALGPNVRIYSVAGQSGMASWLLLGLLCRAVFMSRKYALLLTFGNGTGATGTRTLQFQKDVFSHAEKICVYLRQRSKVDRRPYFPGGSPDGAAGQSFFCLFLLCNRSGQLREAISGANRTHF